MQDAFSGEAVRIPTTQKPAEADFVLAVPKGETTEVRDIELAHTPYEIQNERDDERDNEQRPFVESERPPQRARAPSRDIYTDWMRCVFLLDYFLVYWCPACFLPRLRLA